MKIITVPHSALRQTAQMLTAHEQNLPAFIVDFLDTLDRQRNPRGVGLAAPQVNQNWRLFATFLPETGAPEGAPPIPRIFINPTLSDHSSEVTFGPEEDSPILEGCLSIPHVYGPVPRWEWVTVSFSELKNGDLISKTETFSAFPARVIQHEYDHLQGILFTDYSLEYDLPVYKDRSSNLEEIDKRVLEAF